MTLGSLFDGSGGGEMLEERRENNMTNREKVDYINRRLDMDDLLLAFAEEASEAAQAALKLRRTLYGKNPTPVTPKDALAHFDEEMNDALLCWTVLNQRGREADIISWAGDPTPLQNQKLDRWVKRLQEAEKK